MSGIDQAVWWLDLANIEGTNGSDDAALGSKNIVDKPENDIADGGNHLLDDGSGNDQLFGGDGLDTLMEILAMM